MDETETVVRAYVTACNSDDVESLFAVLHPEIELYEHESLPGPVAAIGLDATRRYLSRFKTHWSSFRWEPLEIRVVGKRALMNSRLELTGRQSGLTTQREWLYLFEVRDGKIYRHWGHDDVAAAEKALAQGDR